MGHFNSLAFVDVFARELRAILGTNKNELANGLDPTFKDLLKLFPSSFAALSVWKSIYNRK